MSITRLVRLSLLPFLLSAQPSFDPATRTRELLDQVLAGKYEPVYELWTPEMQKAMPFDVYRQQLLGLKVLGKPESIGKASIGELQGQKVVTIPVHWQAVTLNFRITWTPEGRISGNWFLNAQAVSPPWERPAYSKPDSFRERELTVGEGEWKLPGTLSVPVGKGPFSGLVLVHGSGTQAGDRDETVFANKVFKDIAEGLSSRGIAVLRYDKRTRVYASKLMGNTKDLTVQQETVEDAVKAAALLRKQPEIDPQRVFVLGHSLGGYVGPRIAKQDGELAGLIVMAGNVRPLEDLIIEQNEYLISLKGGLSPQEQKQYEEVKEQVQHIRQLKPGPDNPSTILGMPIAYLLDLKGYNPAAEAKSLGIPMLVLQGERDFQVSMKDFALWKQALAGRKDAAFHSYAPLSHIFIAGEGKGTLEEYKKPGHVSPEVIDDIAKWINSATSRPSPAPSARNRYCAPCAHAAGI
jgi:alpha-beta hydrolase superfamily lysophospholipase